MATCVGEAKDNVLDLVVDSTAGLELVRLGSRREIVEVSLEQPKGLQSMLARPRRGHAREQHTNSAAVTDSSHKSNRNSSKAIDSLSILIIR